MMDIKCELSIDIFGSTTLNFCGVKRIFLCVLYILYTLILNIGTMEYIFFIYICKPPVCAAIKSYHGNLVT